MAGQAAQTAYGPIYAVAIEQHHLVRQRLVQDDLAIQFLPAGLKAFVNLMRWSLLREWMLSLTERRARGVWGGVLCRKRYIDDKLHEAMQNGMQSVVILGAGLDTRGYRQATADTLPVFEVDLPANIAYKRTKLQTLYGDLPAHLVLVPLDLDNHDLASGLTEQGYRAEYRSIFVWEAVTQYLSADGVQATMRFLSQAQKGSRLVFTYICQDFIDGTADYGMAGLYRAYRGVRPLWQFGLEPGGVASFLAAYGWREIEQVGCTEYTERYLKPLGRELPVMEIERAVWAEKM